MQIIDCDEHNQNKKVLILIFIRLVLHYIWGQYNLPTCLHTVIKPTID